MGRLRMRSDSTKASLMFSAGKTVEVAFDDKDPHEVWVPATVLKYCGDSTFSVEYQQPGNSNQAVLTATVDYWHIRPPPPLPRDKNFGLYDKVDVYYANGWWSGVITKELADNRYNVFFVHNKKERAFIRSKVRPHMKWYDGKWYNISDWSIYEGGANEDATPSLINKQIEQTAPTIAKQSTVATSIMKRTNQTIPERNDNDSSPSKKMKNGTSMDHSSNKSNGTSAGQFEDLDFEFGEFVNSSHGKNRRSTREKGVEQEIQTMDFSKKKGKAVNEIESVKLVKGAKDDSDKTKTQESLEIDATRDLVLPVVTKLHCNEITVSQARIIKKFSNEIVPGAAEGHTKQLDAPSEQLTVLDKEVHEENASTVTPGRQHKLQANFPVTPLKDNHLNEGVDPSVLDSAQMTEGSSPASLGAKSLEKDQAPRKQDKLHNESQVQDRKAKRSRKKYSFGRRKRGKRRTISINANASVLDSEDASKEKADENMETRKMDTSVEQLLDTVSDDQPLSRLIDGMHSPTPTQNPARQPEGVTCGMNAENLPFVKHVSLWHAIESMEVFQQIPQNPHFRPLLEGVNESAREGIAIGTMVMFSNVVDRTYCLKVDNPRSAIEECLETLVELESNGFAVEVIRTRLKRLLFLKEKQEELADWSKGVVDKIEEQKKQEKTNGDEVDEIDRQIRQLEEERKKVLQKKEKWTSENNARKAAEEASEQVLRELTAKFEGLATAPY